jgi:hypothetical protein
LKRVSSSANPGATLLLHVPHLLSVISPHERVGDDFEPDRDDNGCQALKT